MTLLTTVFAAIIATVVWYKGAPQSEMKVGTLCWMYWGASLMWLIDAIFEYAELGAEYFTLAPMDMLNDFYLGLSVAAIGLIIWLVILLVKRSKSSVVQEEISDMTERFCCNAEPLLSYLGFKRKRNELESSYFIHTSLIDFYVLKH